MRVSVTHRALSLVPLPQVVRDPALTFPPSSPSSCFSSPHLLLSLASATSSSKLPSRHASFLLLLLL